MQNDPIISIILPVFNGEKFLDDAIQSCLAQSFESFELIIINDCSTDSSKEIAEKYARLDTRITLINNSSNQKLPASLNIGHKLAKGDFLLWSSDDNIFKPFFLEKSLLAINYSKADIVYCNYDIILENGQLKRKHKTGPVAHIIFGNTIGAAFIYKKEVFKKLNGYDEELHTVEDFDFWLRAALNFKFFHLDENLYKYRIHCSSLSSKTVQNEHHFLNLNEKVIKVFNKLALNLCWSQETIFFFMFVPKDRTFSFFKSHSQKILADIKKFQVQVSENSDSQSTSKLYFLLRQHLKTTSTRLDCRLFIWILQNHPKIFFHNSYSKNETFKLILSFFNFR